MKNRTKMLWAAGVALTLVLIVAGIILNSVFAKVDSVVVCTPNYIVSTGPSGTSKTGHMRSRWVQAVEMTCAGETRLYESYRDFDGMTIEQWNALELGKSHQCVRYSTHLSRVLAATWQVQMCS